MTTEKKPDKMKILFIVLLGLNLIFMIYIAFFKKDALRLESLKAGGTENMQMAKTLYMSPVYIQQQKDTLDQILGSINQVPDTAGQIEVQATGEILPTE